MTNALIPISDMDRMAQAFAKGGLFGTKTPEQCLSLLLLAQAEGQHPALAMRDFDVIQGKPAKKAEAMLRSFIAAGGSVEWHEMSDNKADASFMHPQGSNGKWVRIDWDMARAQKAGLSGKDNYKKFGRQMLANRVISEGCRRVYPAATSGLYVPEEVREIVRQDKRKEKDMGAAEIVPETEPAPQGGESARTAEDSSPSPSPAVAGPVRTRMDTLLPLCDQAGVSLDDMLAKAEVSHPDEMAQEDYDSLLAMLRKRILRKTGERFADPAQP